MAYVRSSLEHRPPTTIQSDMEMGNPSSFEYSALPNDRDRRKSDAHKAQKPLIIFTVNISFLSPFLRYLVLAFGMFFFMCLYGYFQELVVYGWFGRKLSLFCTFLHFLGCSFFAQLQYNYSGRAPIQNDSTSNQANGSSPNAHITAKLNSLSSNLLSNNSGNSKNMKGKIVSFLSCFQAYCHRLQNTAFSMGTAPPRLALGYYLLLVLLKTATQGLTTMCMAHINYPAKVLFKSANPIVTMIFGLVWFGKKYEPRDYVVVALLVIGLYFFMKSSSSKDAPQGTGYGIFLVTMSMFGSAGVPMVQEHCMSKYNAGIEELLYHCYMGSTIISFLLAIFSGEFFEGISFLLNNSDVSTWLSFIAFCSFGYCGANFGAALTHQFGSLVNGITNTARKAVTLALSFALFPERNSLEFHHVFGGCIFFCGLIVRTVMKDNTEKNNNTEMNSKPNLQKFPDNEKMLSQILPENNFSVSERDYFTTVECIGDSNENGENSSGRENGIEDGRRRIVENEIENGSEYYSDNKNKNNYTPLKTAGSAEYNGNRSKTVYENNSKSYDARYNQISENSKTTTLHNNIHYNGIDSIIVNAQSPPFSRKSPMNSTPHRSVNGQNNGFERTENSGIINGVNNNHEKINKNDNDSNNYKNNRNTVSPVFLSSNVRNSTIKNSRSSNTTIV